MNANYAVPGDYAVAMLTTEMLPAVADTLRVMDFGFYTPQRA